MKHLIRFSILIATFLALLSVGSVSVHAQGPVAVVEYETGVNVRENPSVSSPKVAALEYDDTAPLIGKSASGFWYQLQVGGINGWVCKTFVSVKGSLAGVAVTSSIDENCEGRKLSGSAQAANQNAPGPGVQILSVPKMGQYGYLYGRVTGFDPNGYKVACFLYVNGGWWTKPYWSQPTVNFDSKGNFACDVTTGGIDEWATRFLVLVLPRSFNVELSYGDGINSSNLDHAVAAATYDRPS